MAIQQKRNGVKWAQVKLLNARVRGKCGLHTHTHLSLSSGVWWLEHRKSHDNLTASKNDLNFSLIANNTLT